MRARFSRRQAVRQRREKGGGEAGEDIQDILASRYRGPLGLADYILRGKYRPNYAQTYVRAPLINYVS